MFVREQPAGGFSIGGQLLSHGDRPRIFTRITTPHGALDPERRAATAAAVHEEIARAIGRDPTGLGPLDQTCWIDESITPTGGGRAVMFEQIMALLGIDLDARDPVSIPEWAQGETKGPSRAPV